jgi:hypothetical protein
VTALKREIHLSAGCTTIKMVIRVIANCIKIGVTGNAYVMRRVTNPTSDKDTMPKT